MGNTCGKKKSMATEYVVSVDWLDDNKDHVVILDATYDMKVKPDYKEFKQKYYGKFDDLINIKTSFAETYAKEHIPGATLFNCDAAYYPSQYIRFDLYPPEEFEKYVRLLGVNKEDHVIIYSRGNFGGMMWAARAWWTLKAYGHEKVSVLNGGIEAWKKAGKEVTSDITNAKSMYCETMGKRIQEENVFTPLEKPGNWAAKPIDNSQLIKFEELNEKKPGGKSLFEDLSKINYLDARPAASFNGGPGSHLQGSKNVPLDEVVTENGLKSKEQIGEALKTAGYDGNLPIVTGCNGGVQAALLSLALKTAGKESRLYNGSLIEIGLRAPDLIHVLAKEK